MCGIGGIVSWSRPVSADRAAAIADAQKHRGPDGAGSLDWGWLALVHRRLAIIDPAGSAQPMSDPSGRFALTYNGEIFNFRELRAWLEGRGHAFRTAGDVEVLLRLMMEEGADGLPRLDGQFAFAFADRERGTVLLARDRVGIKPMHVARQRGEVLFASELGGILAAIPRPAIRAESVDLFLTLRYVPSPWTIFEGIEKLPPGSAMTIHRDGRVDGPRPWFAIDAPVAPREPSQDEIEGTLSASVRAQLVSDVPLGVLLSGGIDSSLVAGLAAQESPLRLRTVTVGFSDSRFDERPFARVVADAIGSDHLEITADAVARDAPPAFAAFDEPFADSSVIPTAALFRAARSAVTVALGGDGGDELFFGYRVYHRALTAAIARDAAARGGPFSRLRTAARGLVSPRFREAVATSPLDALCATRTMMDEAARRRLYRGGRLDGLTDPLPGSRYLDDVKRRAQVAAGADPMRALMIFDLLSFLPECCLVKVDRLSMRRGLEVRVPLLGSDVLALGLALPTMRKATIAGGACTGGKAPLRRWLARHVAALDVDRTKRGFGAPAGDGNDATIASILPGAGVPGGALQEWIDPSEARALMRASPTPGVRSGEAALTVAVLAAFLARGEMTSS